MKTKIHTAKQEERLEKKKKKLAALAEIMKLNDDDRKIKIKHENVDKAASDTSNNLNKEETESSSSSTMFVEPKRKRQKISDSSDNSNEKIIISPAEKSNELLSNNEYIELKRITNEKSRSSRYKPSIRLNLLGDNASIKVEHSVRTPIFLTDIQHLVMAALFGSESPVTPSRWCVLDKRNRISHTVVLVIEGLALFHYTTYAGLFQECEKIFDNRLEVIMPPYKEGQIIDELMTAPLTDNQRAELIKNFGSLEAALESTQNPMSLVKTVFPITNDDDVEEQKKKSNFDSKNSDEVIPRTQLLLSALQLVDEGYPLPLRGDLANRYKNFIMTKDVYSEVTATSPMFGLDCEMCQTSIGVSELTRISIIDENFQSVYETLVRPENKIVDYLTKYSGITPKMMENVTKTRSEVQQDVRNLLPSNAILVGQSLQCDLLVMQMMHPYIIDTSVIYNITGERKHKSKLQTLAFEFLGEKIQTNTLGHDSIEDCAASLKLTKLKLKKGLYFGDEVLAGRKRANEKQKSVKIVDNIEQQQSITTNDNNKLNQKDTTTAVIISNETNVNTEKYQQIANNNKLIKFHLADNNKMAIKKTRESILDNALTITHLKIQTNRLEMTKIEKTLTKVDRWISNCWDNIAPNGLFIVVLGGVPTVMSGIVMLQIKNNNLKISENKIK